MAVPDHSRSVLALLSLLREYRGLDERGAQVLLSLSNLLQRAAPLARAAAGGAASREARRLLGPLALFGGGGGSCGGAPAPAARLLARHCAEARKQQRNLQVVCDAMATARAQLRDAADELIARAIPPPVTAAAATAAAAAGRDAAAVARGVRALLAVDAARKVAALCAVGAAALILGGGGGGGGGDGGDGGGGRGAAAAWIRRSDSGAVPSVDAGAAEELCDSAAAPDADLDGEAAAAEAERLVESVRLAAEAWSELARGELPWADAAWRASGGATTLGAVLAAQ